MSKYTTELRYICEFEAGLTESEGYNSISDILTEAAPKIFSFDFPIFDETYRPVLEKAILRHFYTREISEETYGLWKLRLEDKMNLIMPYYNKLYETELLEFNPLYDVDYTTTHEGDFSGTRNDASNNTKTLNTSKAESGNTSDTNTRTLNTSKAESGSGTDSNTRTLNTQDTDSGSDIKKNTRWDLFSDTPQGGINGINGDNDSVNDNTYLTNARKIIDDGTGSSFSNTKSSTGTIGDSGTSSMQKITADTGTIGDSGSSTMQKLTNDTGSIEDSGQLASSVRNLDEYTERVFGKKGNISYAKMIMEFRDSFIRIEEKIMKELEPLFFGLW